MEKQKIKAQWANRSKVNKGAFIRLEFDMSRIETPNRMAKMRLTQVMFEVMLSKRLDAVPSCWYQVDVTTNGVLAVAAGIETIDNKTPESILDVAKDLLYAEDYSDWAHLEMFELAKAYMDSHEEPSEYYSLLVKVGLPYHYDLVTRSTVNRISVTEYTNFLRQMIYGGCCNVVVYADTQQAEAIKLHLSELFDWSDFSMRSRSATKIVNDSYAVSTDMASRPSALFSRLYQLKTTTCSPLVIDAICTIKYLAKAYDIDCKVWLRRNELYLLFNSPLQGSLGDGESTLYQSIARERDFDLSKLPVTCSGYLQMKEEWNGMMRTDFNYLDKTSLLYDMMIRVSADTFNAGVISPKDIYDGISLSIARNAQSFLERFDVSKNQESLALLQCCYYQQPSVRGFNDKYGNANVARVAEMVHALMKPSENN
ncbi:MAG: hypothetical protein Q4C83_00235 [Candidatus Saccharibacteria bacterium]|nr:hypothetical protein [Candidatus Saccharibacteria bacterium]